MTDIARKHQIFSILAGSVLPGSFTALIEYLMTGGVAGPYPIVAAIIGGLASAAFVVFLTNRTVPKDDVTSGSRGPTKASDPNPTQHARSFSPRTPEELCAEREGMTSLVADEVSKRHIGQRLKVEGWVDNVTDFNQYIQVDLHSLQDGKRSAPLFRLRFDDTIWRPKVAAQNKGDRILAEGRIEKIGSVSIYLGECELLE